MGDWLQLFGLGSLALQKVDNYVYRKEIHSRVSYSGLTDGDSK
jgi:hypothetical protein